MKDYVKSIIEKGSRLDNRNLLDWRKPIKIEIGVSKKSEGSAKVTIGETEVIAGIKMNVGEPYPDSLDEGVLITGAELLPLSSPDFTAGPPDQQTIELARVVDRGIRESNMIDMKKLCIKEGELVWTVFLDIYTINDAGNLIDASALAAVVALKNTVFPKLEKDKVKFGEFTKNKLPIQREPVVCTLYKIGEKIIVDPTNEEEEIAEARLSVAIDEKDNVNALQKGGSTSLNIGEIDEMVKIAIEKTKELRKVLKWWNIPNMKLLE